MLVNAAEDEATTQEELQATGLLLIGIDSFVLIAFAFSIFAAFYALKKKLDHQDAIKRSLRKKLRSKFLSHKKKSLGGVHGAISLFCGEINPTTVQPIQSDADVAPLKTKLQPIQANADAALLKTKLQPVQANADESSPDVEQEIYEL